MLESVGYDVKYAYLARKGVELARQIHPEWLPVKAFLEKPIKPAVLLGEIKKLLG